MIRRISSVGLVVALVTALLPVHVFADERPLASLKTAEGLQTALQSGQTLNAQAPTRTATGTQVLKRQNSGGQFFSSTGGKVAIAALVAVGAYFAISTWDTPKPARPPHLSVSGWTVAADCATLLRPYRHSPGSGAR